MMGAETNICYNALDKQVDNGHGDKVAFYWVGNDPNDKGSITYAQLLAEVCKFVNALESRGVKPGDRVALYLPMITELVVAMLAWARIGAVHSIVFGGYSADSLATRILDAGARVLITADGVYRGTKLIKLLEIANSAMSKAADQGCAVKTHICVSHLGRLHTPGDLTKHKESVEAGWVTGRDEWWHAVMKTSNAEHSAVMMDSEAPLFMLYTSGSTGKPKGVLHSTAGYMLYTMHTVQTVFDLQPNDIFACVADVGWITGHSYIVYGPLAAGTTTLMFESIPTYPDVSRYWAMIEEHKVTQFYTAPTAIRALAKHGVEPVKKHDLSTCRVLGTVGEPINPEAWNWYHTIVGQEKCTIVDTYWQTETGGHMLTPIPGCTDLKAGSATLPFFGIEFALLDGGLGNEIHGNDKEGILCVKKPWPSMARTVYANHQRYLDTYMNPYKGYYFTGDGARRDKDGLYWITGRVDDVVNVSGHRLGTAEIEACLATHPEVAEAACVGIPDDIKGQALFVYCVPSTKNVKADFPKTLNQLVRSSIGAFAAPKNILIVPEVPKTRSGKVMRRLLRKIGTEEYAALGDVTTLSNADAVEEIIRLRKAMK